MKKFKLLAPIISLGAVATTAGAISACSCSKSMVLDQLKTIEQQSGSSFTFLTTKEAIDLKEQEPYKFEVKLSMWEGLTDEKIDNFSIFYISETEKCDFTEINGILKASVSVDGKELKDVSKDIDDPTHMEPNEFWVGCPFGNEDEDGDAIIMISGSTFSKNSKLIINVEVEDAKKSYPVFTVEP